MSDLWEGCFDPRFGSPKDFASTFCKVCRNPGCERATGRSWAQRMSTQMDRLFVNPKFADPNDPSFADIRKVDFPSAFMQAMRLEISDIRGDWSVPSNEDVIQMAQPQSPGQPVVEPPVGKVLQHYTIRGSQGDEYEVELVEPAVGHPAQWRCSCKAFEFKKQCKHIDYASTLPPEDELEDEPVQDARPPGPAMPQARSFIPSAGNTPAPTGGRMIDGSRAPSPLSRTPAPPVVDDPWAAPPPKPKVIPVGGKVVLGGGDKK